MSCTANRSRQAGTPQVTSRRYKIQESLDTRDKIQESLDTRESWTGYARGESKPLQDSLEVSLCVHDERASLYKRVLYSIRQSLVPTGCLDVKAS